MRPFYEVGEEVYYQGTKRPNIKGVSTIIGVYLKGEEVHRTDEARYSNTRHPVVYKLSDDELNGLAPQVAWEQSQLRKKHKGCGGFDSLMGYLESGKVESI